MSNPKTLTKAEMEKALENMAHIANALRADLMEVDEASVDRRENDFWEAMSAIPADMRESVIN